MKIKIEIDCPGMFDPIQALQRALKPKETRELLECYKAGDHFSMNDDRRGVKITFTVIEPKTPA